MSIEEVLRADPIRDTRRLKRLALAGVYITLPLVYLAEYFLLDLSLYQLAVLAAISFGFTTATIELAFRQGFRLRKRSVYPLLAVAGLGGEESLQEAIAHSLAVLRRLLRLERSFVALLDEHNLPRYAAGLAVSTEEAESMLTEHSRAVWDAISGRQVSEAASGWLFTPLVALGQPSGVLALLPAQGAADCRDRHLLLGIGSSLGLTLDNVRQKADLRERQENFRLLFTNNPHPMWVYDRDSLRFLEVNSAAVQGYGYTREEFLRMRITDIRPEENVPALLAKVRGARGDLSHRGQWRHRKKSGTIFDVEVTSHTIPFLDGEGVLVVAQDITERTQAERALRESEELFSKAFRASPAAIAITSLVDQRYLDVNDVFLHLLGYSREEVIGRTALELGIWPELDKRQQIAETLDNDGSLRDLEISFQAKGGAILHCFLSVERIELNGEPCALSLAHNVTERRRAEEALRKSEEHFRSLIENNSDIIVVVGLDGRFTYASPSVDSLGYRPESIIGATALELVHPEDLPEVTKSFERVVAGTNAHVAIEFRIRHADGGWRTLEARSQSLADDSGIVVNCRDITDRKRAEDLVQHLAYHDALTNLPNRELFRDRLRNALAQARRNDDQVGVLFLDLDRFKLVNDTVGHAGGDEMLKLVAEQFSALLRDGDTLARVGGDEFCVLLPSLERVEDAVEVAERILERTQVSQLLGGQEFHVTASIGLSIFPNDGVDADELLRNADTAMYRAKDEGRNNYQLYSPAMNQDIHARVVLENELRHALARGEFVVYYQPQADVATGEVRGVEALIRWQHPERGLILPGDFIPLAEETGLIVPIGEWVLRTACAQVEEWRRSGLPPVLLAVNLSARQFLQAGLASMVAGVLKETGLSAGQLELEITESIAMQNAEVTIALLRAFQAMGVHIAIDDFGTGYSSLSYLKHFPIHTLKIDRSFVKDVTEDANDAAIAIATIAMAHSLNLRVVAEGVETAQQLEFLRQRGCDEFQGFFLARPAPPEVLAAALASQKVPSSS